MWQSASDNDIKNALDNLDNARFSCPTGIYKFFSNNDYLLNVIYLMVCDAGIPEENLIHSSFTNKKLSDKELMIDEEISIDMLMEKYYHAMCQGVDRWKMLENE